MKWFSHWRDFYTVLKSGLPTPPAALPAPPRPETPFEDEVRGLMASPTWGAAQFAVQKIRPQRRLRLAGNHAQKEQATEWGLTYAREALGTEIDTWELRFLIEVAIGIEKGRLPRL